MSTPFDGKSTAYSAALIAVVLCGPINNVDALTIFSTPGAQVVNVQDTFRLDVWFDNFGDDPTIGGGFNISWNPAILDFVEWDFSTSTINDDPDLRREGTLSKGLLADVQVFGSILTTGVIGSVTFLAIAPGESSVDPGPSSIPWLSPDFISVLPVDFSNTAVTVEVIPIPAGAWLMISSLAMLLGFRRRWTLPGVRPTQRHRLQYHLH